MELLCVVHKEEKKSGATHCNLVRSTKVEKKYHGGNILHIEKTRERRQTQCNLMRSTKMEKKQQKETYELTLRRL
jgi:hypothetical protein